MRRSSPDGVCVSCMRLPTAGALMTAADGPSARVVFAFLTGAQALFGFGCGGEFPVAAACAPNPPCPPKEIPALSVTGGLPIFCHAFTVPTEHALQ